MKARVSKRYVTRKYGRNYNEVKKAIKKRENVKIDWKVIGKTETVADRVNPEYVAQFTTSGFDKYGFGEVVVVGRVKNGKKITELINRFCVLLAKGEEFEPDARHAIEGENGKEDFVFDIFYGRYENGGIWVQLIPDFENNL